MKYIKCEKCGANLDPGEHYGTDMCNECAKMLTATGQRIYHPDELREVGIIPKKNRYIMQYM